ncbi:hypothetical protein L1076_06865 [Vibrio sp. MMG022]|uniref:hypothetical protein n=1 Tax=Vibrio TaxID=662 RepID=UPI000576473D|nr:MULTISPECIES: hypothetical protein [Vibrio]MCF6451307.1 hypothetical protein [Vibrio sp. MMG023]
MGYFVFLIGAILLVYGVRRGLQVFWLLRLLKLKGDVKAYDAAVVEALFGALSYAVVVVMVFWLAFSWRVFG